MRGLGFNRGRGKAKGETFVKLPGPHPGPGFSHSSTDNKGDGPISLRKGEGHLLVIGSEFGTTRMVNDR